MEEVYFRISECLKDGTSAVVATVVESLGSSPRKAGSKMLVLPGGEIVGTIGGGKMELRVTEEALRVMETGEPNILEFDLTDESVGICGGHTKVFLEPLLHKPSLVVVGGGHIGYFLARYGGDLGFRVTVVDDREEFLTAERFPGMDRVQVQDYGNIPEEYRSGQDRYAVIMTRGHDSDRACLRAFLKEKLHYLGMVGSRKKIARIFKALREEGVSEEKLSTVKTPIGLNLGGESPAEIAFSIAAEILAHRHGAGDIHPLSKA